MSIPLIQKPEKDDINTSIIAIKRNIERINMLLGLSNSEEIDTSEFVKKSDIVDVVEAGNMNPVTSNAVVPVDEVTLGNMHSVTSNSVAESIEDINTVLDYAMLPREGGVTQSSAQFLASLVHTTQRRAPASFGSINLTDGPIGNVWYNYIWIPHRNGIGGDNYLFGTCILMCMMNNLSTIWLNHLINGTWYGWQTNS